MLSTKGIFAFARETAGQTAYVVLNRSSSPAKVQVPVEVGGRLVDWMNPDQVSLDAATQDRPTLRVNGEGYQVEDGKVSLTLSPFGTAILVAP